MEGLVDLRGPWRAIVRAPLVRFATPMLIGVACSPVVPIPAQVLFGAQLLTGLLMLLILLFPAFPGYRKVGGYLLYLSLFCFGLYWGAAHAPQADPHHLVQERHAEGPWAVQVQVVNGTSGRVFRADARVIGQFRGDTLQAHTGNVLLALLADAGEALPRAGDRLLVDAPLERIDRVADPGGFDRAKWAASRGMYYELFAPAGHWRPVDHRMQWTDPFTGLRARISTWLDGSDLPLRERALVKALVLGQRDELDSGQRQAFSRSGTIHVLAVSGMHVGLIFAIFSFLLAWWGHSARARVLRGLFILLALWGYAGLTGGSPSVLRATIMFSLFTWANMYEQRTDHLNSLFGAAMILLVVDPDMLWSYGFQLSFLAVFGIILFYRPLRGLLLPESKLIASIWALAVVSISAQLLTGPLSVYLFKAFPMWFLPANIVVVTAVGIAVNASVALIVLYKVPVVGTVLTWALTMLLQGVGIITAFVGGLPGAYPDIRIGAGTTVLIYLLLFALSAWWLWGWRSMRWVVTGLVVLLVLDIEDRVRSTNASATFTVYDSGVFPMASMQNGRSLVVLCDADSLPGHPAMLKRLENHRRTEGLNEPLILDHAEVQESVLRDRGATLAGAGRWASSHFQVAVLDSGRAFEPLGEGRAWDVLLVQDARALRHVPDSVLQGAVQHLVLWGSSSRWSRNKVQERCAALRIPFHAVREQGAFILRR